MILAAIVEDTIDALLAGVLFLLIISVFINLFFIQEKFRNTTNSPKSKKQRIEAVRAFLEEQADATINVNKHRDKNLIRLGVVKLRSAYLAIESKCIDRFDDQDAYWNLLNAKLQKLYQILTEQQTAKPLLEIEGKISIIKQELEKIPKTKSTRAVNASLDKFHRACMECSNNPKKLAHYNEKLNSILMRLFNSHFQNLTESSHAQSQFSETAKPILENLSKVNLNSTQPALSLCASEHEQVRLGGERFASNSKAIQANVESLQNSFEEARIRVGEVKQEAMNTSSEDKIKSLNLEIKDISDQMLAASDREIDRLRGIVGDQKQVIKDLELAIAELSRAIESDPQNPNLPQLQNLQKNLHEAEQCIVMLEGELETLRQKRHDIETLGDERVDKPVINENNVDTLLETINKLESEISESRYAQQRGEILYTFIRDAMDAATIEDVSILIYQTLIDLKFLSNLLIYANNRTLEVNPSGKLDARDKLLINNMQVKETNINGKRLSFRMLNIGGKLLFNSEHVFGKDEQKMVLDLITISDKVLGKLKRSETNAQKKRSYSDLSNVLKVIISDVDQSIEKLIRRSESVVRDSFGQIQDVGRSKGFNASQIAGLKSLEKSALDDLESEARVRLKLKKEMLSLLQKMEDSESPPAQD